MHVSEVGGGGRAGEGDTVEWGSEAHAVGVHCVGGSRESRQPNTHVSRPRERVSVCVCVRVCVCASVGRLRWAPGN
jgi:hypothetical protein